MAAPASRVAAPRMSALCCGHEPAIGPRPRMSTKKAIFFGMAVGGFVGGWIPSLWGAGSFSLQSVIFGTIGGLVGIWAGYKFANG